MNWRKAPAEVIETLPRGTRVKVDGLEYIRMADSPSSHVEGYLFYPEDGWWGHWSRVAYKAEVEVPDESVFAYYDPTDDVFSRDKDSFKQGHTIWPLVRK